MENNIGDKGATGLSLNTAWKNLKRLEMQGNKEITEIGKKELKKNFIFGSFVNV